ncbi:hypothetical protein BH10ACT1_BH10ACT1_07770 [soil metagenome]
MNPSAEPTLSVVIAVLDGGPLLSTQLEGLVAQVGPTPFEVIICDNGSSDDSVDRARGFDDRLDLHVLDASARRGQTFARNAGAARARGSFLVFLDQDDLVDPGYLAALTTALDAHDFVAARMETEFLNPASGSQVRSLTQVSTLPTDPVPWGYGCTLGILRSQFEALGGFDTNLYVAAEDIDLCIRAAAAGIELVYVPEAILHYRFPTAHRALFRQGRRYGIGHAAVARKHRLPAPRARPWSRELAGATKLFVLARQPGQRGRASFVLGRKFGQVEGWVRYRRSWRDGHVVRA